MQMIQNLTNKQNNQDANLASMQSQINDLKNRVTSAESTIRDIAIKANSIPGMQNQITNMNSQISSIKTGLDSLSWVNQQKADIQNAINFNKNRTAIVKGIADPTYIKSIVTPSYVQGIINAQYLQNLGVIMNNGVGQATIKSIIGPAYIKGIVDGNYINSNVSMASLRAKLDDVYPTHTRVASLIDGAYVDINSLKSFKTDITSKFNTLSTGLNTAQTKITNVKSMTTCAKNQLETVRSEFDKIVSGTKNFKSISNPNGIAIDDYLSNILRKHLGYARDGIKNLKGCFTTLEGKL